MKIKIRRPDPPDPFDPFDPRHGVVQKMDKLERAAEEHVPSSTSSAREGRTRKWRRSAGAVARNALSRLWRAIERFELENDCDVFARYLERAMKEDRVMVALFNRLIPLQTENTVKASDVQVVIRQVVEAVSQNVTDPDQVKAIADECNRIAAFADSVGPGTN